MLPLTNTKVLDLSWWLPGPYATMLLADLGAEVIKVEPPGRGDPARKMLPGLYEIVNSNKKCITLNLKNPEGCRLFYQLCTWADIIVEGFRPGVVQRLRVDYETVKQYNPEIIYCSISGYGQDGPYALHPSHDVTCLALSGALSIPGDYDPTPVRPGLPVADLAAAMFSAFSVVSLLVGRLRGGKGSFIDISMTDSLVSWVGVRAGAYLSTGRMPDLAEMPHLFPTNRVFPTKDGRYLAIGILEEDFWQILCRALGKEELTADGRFATSEDRKKNWRSLISILEELFRSKTLDEWRAILSEYDLPWKPVYTIEEAFSDPHIKQRGTIKEVEVNGKRIRQIGYPGKFSAFSLKDRNPAPALGQHNKEIYEGLLQLTGEELEKLYKQGII
ncbi:CaiB/BaiF CoA transferase family protein [Desulfofundulus thermocisternus]|uniref:CaiB/BaiF CoA transferase family protein n=1 Tax=Desulfofundulus thermocisternus TaxID=42471 RepID=UPI00217D40A8|nr:CaiB/BaiF CoA-transferase family protein [Desulfofundulus thermocisternus]MCS5694718.1 CoA transferase [Desulfofundulus thermocisternus]